VVISALLRVVLWGVFGRQAGAGLFELIASLPLGATNDFTTLIYLLFPLSLLLAILPQRQINNRCMQWLALTGVATLLFGIFYLACAEYFFFEEFNARFNRVAVDYLIYPHEVFINIWESYHVVWFLLGCGSISLLLTWWLRRLLIRREIPDEKLRNRLSFVGIHLLALILTIVSVSTDTLSLFNNRVSNEITANGISSIFRALRTNELNYSAYYPTMNNATAFELIRNELGRHGELTAKDQPQNITRNFAARPGLGKLNIVVVVEESFGAQFVGAYGAQQGLTPNFDRLAKEGLLVIIQQRFCQRHPDRPWPGGNRHLLTADSGRRDHQAPRQLANRQLGGGAAAAGIPYQLSLRRLRPVRQHEPFFWR